jgi:hypothetical protein
MTESEPQNRRLGYARVSTYGQTPRPGGMGRRFRRPERTAALGPRAADDPDYTEGWVGWQAEFGLTSPSGRAVVVIPSGQRTGDFDADHYNFQQIKLLVETRQKCVDFMVDFYGLYPTPTKA